MTVVRALAIRRPIVVFDAHKTERDLQPLLREVAAGAPPARLIAYGVDGVDATMKYIEAGAAACLAPRATLHEFLLMVESVNRGEMPASAALAGAMFARLRQLAANRELLATLESTDLTARQFEIIRLLGRGLSNREIALRLAVSFHTVKNHVGNVLHKLDVSTRAEAVALVRSRGWSGFP